MADSAKVLSVMLGEGKKRPVLSIEVKPQDAKKNDAAPGTM